MRRMQMLRVQVSRGNRIFRQAVCIQIPDCCRTKREKERQTFFGDLFKGRKLKNDSLRYENPICTSCNFIALDYYVV